MTEQSPLKIANLGLSFLLELALLAAFAVWGAHAGQTLLVKILLGAGLPFLVALIWWFFMAPRGKYQLKGLPYTLVKVILFALAVLALFAAGRSGLAWALAALTVLNIAVDIL